MCVCSLSYPVCRSQSFRLHTETALKELFKLTEKPQQSNEEESDEEQEEEEEEAEEEEKNSPKMTFGTQTEILP
jgi:hypothetical protein